MLLVQDFTNRLLEGVKSGAITTKEALEDIAEETERVGLNAQQSAQLTADLFRGAGEDAGGFQKVIEAVNIGLQEQQREYNSLEAFQRANIESTKALKEAQDEAFRSDGFIKFKTQLITGWNNIQIVVLKAISGIRKSFSGFINGIEIIGSRLQPVINYFKAFSKTIIDTTRQNKVFNKTLEVLGGVVKFLVSPISSILSMLTSLAGVFNGLVNVVYSFDDAVRQTFRNFSEIFENFDITKPFESFKNIDFSGVKTAGSNLANAFIDGYNEVVEENDLIDKVVKNIEVNENVNTGNTTSTSSGFKRVAEEIVLIASKTAESIRSILNLDQILGGVTSRAVNKAKEDIDKLVAEYQNGTKTSSEFLQGVRDVNERVQNDIINDSIYRLETQLLNEDLTADEIKDIHKSLAEFKKKLRDEELKDIIDKAEASVQAEIDAEAEKKRLREKTKRDTIAVAQATFSTINSIANELYNNQTYLRNRELEEANKEYEYKMLLAESENYTDSELKAQQLKASEELASKEREIKYKQAKADKEQALFNAVINTAQAVTSALSTQPFLPLGPIMAGLAGALGAVQIGIISSRSIPKYKTGLDKAKEDHIGIIGDAGREIMIKPTGEMLLAEKEMAVNVPKGAKILTNKETEYLLNQQNSRKKELSLLEGIKNKKTIVYNNIIIKSNKNSYTFKN